MKDEKISDDKQVDLKKQQAESGLLAEDDGRDWIDDLCEEMLSDWVPLMTPLEEQLVDLAAKSRSFEEFHAGLAKLAANFHTDELQEALASAMFASWQIANNGERNA